MDSDEFVLNLSGFSGDVGLQQPSRTTQRRRQWAAKREIKKSRYKKQNVQRNGNGLHLKSAPAIATQLKGYSLDALKITAQRAQPSISAKIPSEISTSTYKGTVNGSSKAASLQKDLKSFDANHGKSRQEPEGASNERIEKPQGKATSWDRRSQHSAKQPLCETSGKQKQLLFHEHRTERGNQAWSERALKHSTSGVSRYARGSQEISSDTHGMKPNTRRISGGRKEQLQRGRPKWPSAVVDGENGKRVGRLRLLSKAAGERESTPDQDDIRAPESDTEPGDVLAAVTAAVERDRRVQDELAKRHSMRFAEDSDPDQDEHLAGRALVKQKANIRIEAARCGKERGIFSAKAAESNSSALGKGADEGFHSDDEKGESSPGVVDFGGDYASGYQRRPPLKSQYSEKQQGQKGPALKAKPRVSVRPGELVHGGRTGGARAGCAERANSGVEGELFPATADDFPGLGLSQEISDHLASLGFASPTRVQQQTIPPLLGGQDVLVHAATGSGKTLSYLAPIVDSLAAQAPRIQRSAGTYALVITPTRELCLQVADVLTLLVRRFVWVVGGGVHGGENRSKEKARLRKGVSILVATPGRLLDHLQNTHAFKTDLLGWLVLDEADRLLDMGFEKKIAEIVSILDQRCRAVDYSHSRRTALLSATLHSNLGSLVSLSLKSPAAIGFRYRTENGEMVILHDEKAGDGKEQAGQQAQQASTSAERYQIPKQLQQRFVEIPCKLRLVALAAALHARLQAAPSEAKVVVFFSNCDSVEFYHAVLAGVWEGATGAPLLPGAAPIFKLHGNLTQAERTEAFLGFTKCKAGVLLCTDVAARGLDFPAVTTILQFDPPGEAAEYVHRVGRTARLGQRGDALLCLLPSERPYLDHLRQHGVALQQQPLPSLLSKLPVLANEGEQRTNAAKGSEQGGRRERGVERHQRAYLLQKVLMDAVERDKGLQRLGEDAFRSYVRAYATHSTELKPIFHIKSLHLGHVAHSFALRERPSMVGQSSSKASLKKRKAEAAKAKGKREKRQRAQAKAVAVKGEAMAGYNLM